MALDHKTYQAAYYQANKERIKARVKAYAEAHSDEICAYKKAYGEKNKEELKAKAKADYQAHRDERIAKQTKYAEAHRDNVKAYKKGWWESNRDREVSKKRANSQRARVLAKKWYEKNYCLKRQEFIDRARARRAMVAGASIGPKIDFAKILRESHGICGICRKPFNLFGIDFDHIVPLSKGGSHTQDNLQATHSYCNRAKGSRLA